MTATLPTSNLRPNIRDRRISPRPSRPGAWALRALVLPLAAFAGLFVQPVTASATAETLRNDTVVTPDEMNSGALLLRRDDRGHYVEAPRVKTDVEITVSGPTARARVTQMFHNPTKGWVEGVYVYPLPQDAAVDTLKMIVGDRVIVADIKERKAAKAIYEQAKAYGRKASLVEQERPNLFTNSVANIGPGETVVVQIEYQEPILQNGEEFSLRVPLVVAPRYNPVKPDLAPIVQTGEAIGNDGWGKAEGDPVPDRDRITPPVTDPRQEPEADAVTIAVRLNAGFPIGTVESPYHKVSIDKIDANTRQIHLDGPVPANRDFVLEWMPAKTASPSVGLFSEIVGGKSYALAFVTPPVESEVLAAKPREVIFVIDNSGSMGGPSMDQAKTSLDYALQRLKPDDRFNVIRFDDSMDVLFSSAAKADRENVAKARNFVGRLEAEGGTEMLAPLEPALTESPAGGSSDTAGVRQVVFLTDGAIGNEQQLLDTIASRRGRSRIFMVGIGSAPNSYLMNRAAELGRGTFTHIGSSAEVEQRMRELFDKLENPVVTDLTARFSQGGVDVTPASLPDLYRGEPVVLSAQMPSSTGTLRIEGRIGNRPWQMTLDLAKAAKGSGISKLWARRKIADAEVERTLGRISGDEADRRILKLALRHSLVTRLTSLVAVDETPSRPQGARLTREEIPLDLPAGWDFDKVFGQQPSIRASIDGPRLAGVRSASSPSANGEADQQVLLPQTATDAGMLILGGLLTVWLGLVLLFVTGGRGRPAK